MYTVKTNKYYFCCIITSRFWNAQILLHFNVAFSQRSAGIYQAFDMQAEFLRVFDFVILSYLRNKQQFSNKHVIFCSTINKTANPNRGTEYRISGEFSIIITFQTEER